MERVSDKKGRNSNIELLKIIAMYMIVICHVVADLPNDTYVGFSDFVYLYYRPARSMVNLVLTILHQLGFLGNTIFFTCSAWYLLENNKVSIRKIIGILVDIEVISASILLAYYLARRGNISKSLAIQILFPHTFRLYWYLTCYVLFYLIHPILNDMIIGLSKCKLLRIAFFSGAVFIVYNFFSQWYFGSVIISWIVLYFLIAYIKCYLTDFQQNKGLNIILFLFGIVGVVLIPLIINTNGINSGNNYLNMQKYDDISRWNPFHVIISLSLFNLSFHRKVKHNPAINYISSVSLLCFAFHSNRIMRCYLIPYAWERIYLWGGYRNIVEMAIMLGSACFVISMALSIVYNETIHRFVYSSISPRLSKLAKNIWRIVEKKLLELR